MISEILQWLILLVLFLSLWYVANAVAQLQSLILDDAKRGMAKRAGKRCANCNSLFVTLLDPVFEPMTIEELGKRYRCSDCGAEWIDE